MNCPKCDQKMAVANSVDIGIGTIPFEWHCRNCGIEARESNLDDGNIQFYQGVLIEGLGWVWDGLEPPMTSETLVFENER